MRRSVRQLFLVMMVLSSASCGSGGELVGDGGEDAVVGDDGVAGDDTVLGDDAAGEDPAVEDVRVDDAIAQDIPGDETSTENCPGYVRPPFVPPGSGADCRSGADCETNEFCWLPGMSVCGACPTPTYECGTDEDCGGEVCIELPKICEACPQPPGTQCIPRCTAGSCLDGERCDEATGHCVPVLCTEGYSCPLNSRCGGEGEGDGHRCVTLDCSVDADCDCGVCISGTCFDGPGACSGLVA